jgi:DNA-binding ferritin-like protein
MVLSDIEKAIDDYAEKHNNQLTAQNVDHILEKYDLDDDVSSQLIDILLTKGICRDQISILEKTRWMMRQVMRLMILTLM